MVESCGNEDERKSYMVRFCGKSEPTIYLKIFAAGAISGCFLLFLAWVEAKAVETNGRKKERASARETLRNGYSGIIAKLCTTDFTPDNVATVKSGQFKGGFYSFQSEDLIRLNGRITDSIDSKITQKKNSRGECHQLLEEYLQTNNIKVKKQVRWNSSLLRSRQMFWKNLTSSSIFNNYWRG